METRLLETFIVLAEELHIGKTADRLHVSPATISQRLAQLEKRIGGKLADRSTRSLVLTDLGHFLLNEATVLLDQMSAAKRRVQARASGSSGRLHISFIGSVGPVVLPELVGRVSANLPNMALEFGSHAFTRKIEELLELRRTDLGIVRTPVRSAALEWRPLYDDPLVLLVPATHRLAKAQKVDLNSVKDETHIVFPQREGSVVADQAMRMCREAGYEPRKTIEIYETLTGVGLVAAGMGVSIMPLSTRRIVGLKGITHVECKNGIMTQVAMVWRKDDTNPLRQRFVKEMERVGRLLRNPV
ncbi:Morphology and auto-aggregation control protein [Trueperella bialowiezensis]|uniref:Morphology and auto-aggregation control protein n=2 Tax=Trueperella bialowiezensis TaxID=312285 RepID=A0A3S4VA80_9ACTO|nr:Morphology and auto-aggregation control protein [Trueperella bialowiezensis]